MYSNIRRLRLGWGEGSLWGEFERHTVSSCLLEKNSFTPSPQVHKSCTKCKPLGIQQEETGTLVTYINFWRRIIKKATRIYIYDSLRTNNKPVFEVCVCVWVWVLAQSHCRRITLPHVWTAQTHISALIGVSLRTWGECIIECEYFECFVVNYTQARENWARMFKMATQRCNIQLTAISLRLSPGSFCSIYWFRWSYAVDLHLYISEIFRFCLCFPGK